MQLVVVAILSRENMMGAMDWLIKSHDMSGPGS